MICDLANMKSTILLATLLSLTVTFLAYLYMIPGPDSVHDLQRQLAPRDNRGACKCAKARGESMGDNRTMPSTLQNATQQKVHSTSMLKSRGMPRTTNQTSHFNLREWPTIIARPPAPGNRHYKLVILQEAVEPHLRELLGYRKASLPNNNTAWAPLETPRYRADMTQRSYFDILWPLYRYVRTIMLRLDRRHLASVMVDPYYDYASPSCDKIKSRSLTRSREYEYRCWPANDTRCLMPSDAAATSETFFGPGFLGFRDHSTSTHLAVSYIHVIKAAVVNRDGDVFSRDLKIVNSIESAHCLKVTSLSPLGVNETTLPVYDEVFSIASYYGKEYYHFVAQHLPRLGVYVDFLKKFPRIKIHCSWDKSFSKNFVGMLGLDTGRIVSGIIRTRLLYRPEVAPCGQPLPFPVAFTASVLQNNVATSRPRDHIILIKRFSRRYFLHHDAILRMLQTVGVEYGLEVWVFDDHPLPPFQEMVERFHRSVVVVGPHGAGFTNLMFSPPGTFVIEGLCYGSLGHKDGHLVMCYRSLAHALQHIYYGLVLEGISCYNVTAEDVEKPLRWFFEKTDRRKVAQ